MPSDPLSDALGTPEPDWEMNCQSLYQETHNPTFVVSCALGRGHRCAHKGTNPDTGGWWRWKEIGSGGWADR